MKILISGAGIAGLTAAYWLREYGFQPIVVEKAPPFERSGFLIGFRGPSITVLRHMNLLDNTLALGIGSIRHDTFNSKGRRINHSLYLSYKEDERGKLPINRADLHAVLYEAVKDTVEIRFGTAIEAVQQYHDGVGVHFGDGQYETFDLLIGADGVHSHVRRLVFGEGFEQVLDATYAAFISPKTRPVTSMVQFAKGRMSVVYDLNPDEFGGIFIFKGHDFAAVPPDARKAGLMERHDQAIADTLANISDDTCIYVDRLIQIAMPRWFDGRVVIVGDAAYALSPASGFGGTAAIAGAYILAQEIARHGLAGLNVYDQRMRGILEKKQKTAARVVNQIVSDNPILITVRDFLLRVMQEKSTYKTRAVDNFGISETDRMVLVAQT